MDSPLKIAVTGGIGCGKSMTGSVLQSLGIVQRASALKRRASANEVAAIDSGLRRLTGSGDNDMGVLFKAMAIAHPGLTSLPGFAQARTA